MLARNKLFYAFLWFLYACASVQFIRFYVVSTYFYLDMPRYLSGHERLPFQERILPIFLMWPINHSMFLMHHLAHNKGDVYTPSAATPETLAFYIVSLISFLIASLLVYQLYRKVTVTGTLAPLVLPIFLVLTLWTYVVHIDADYSYPYDMPSVAFFAGGLLCIYTGRFWPLLPIMFFGTMNRETTLFLIGIYVIDAATRQSSRLGDQNGQQTRSLADVDFRRLPWIKTGVLVAIWLSVKLTVHHHFAHNDASEDFVRLWGNLGRLRPRLWPILFNVCGYLLPIVLILQGRIRPRRFASYLYIFPVWFGVMLYTGVILETRIYGELCSYVAVATVLLLEASTGPSQERVVPLSTSEHQSVIR